MSTTTIQITQTSPWKENQVSAKVFWKDMDFGTEENPQCGICGHWNVVAHWRKGRLQEDVICDDCADEWKYDSDEECYNYEEKVLPLEWRPANLLHGTEAEEEHVVVEECKIEGKIYLRDYYNTIYDNETEDEVGKYNFVRQEWTEHISCLR